MSEKKCNYWDWMYNPDGSRFKVCSMNYHCPPTTRYEGKTRLICGMGEKM